jgi:glycerol-3-phosphate acyltransferase PlsX
MARIAVDAMGGDRAPDVELDAVALALREKKTGVHIVLCGDEARLRAGLEQRGVSGDPRLQIRHAPEVILMDDAPVQAVRSKKNSSMRVCFDLVKQGQADAVVSAGNSGAMLACGLLVLKRLRGVERPGIVTTFPTLRTPCVLCDMGANVDIKPQVLAQFGVLGCVYAQVVYGKARPRVGLLSNGEEESKGTELTREAHALLVRAAEGADFEYVGYVEGKDIFSGDLDVVATDGFTGNVVLKASEGAAHAIITLLKQAFRSTPRAMLGGLLAAPALRELKKKLDYAETGGALLAGVNGVALVCHGSSSDRALMNAIFTAASFVDLGLGAKLAERVARHRSVFLGTEGDAPSTPPNATHPRNGRQPA